MGLKRNFLADENAAQDRRSRALHRFLVATPLVLLLTVGAVGHVQKPPHADAHSDQAYDQAILAYRDRVTAVNLLARTPARIARRLIGAELLRWREEMRLGHLRPIPPIAYEDHLRDGLRGEIVHTGLDLVDMSFAEVQARAATDPKGAVDEAITAAEVAKGLENFELQAKLLAMIPLRRSLATIEGLWPRLDRDDRRTFAGRIADLKSEAGEVDRLAKVEWANVDDYARRQQISPSNRAKLPERPSKYLINAVEHSDQEVNRAIDKLLASA